MPYSTTRLKVQLKLAVGRFRLLKSKKDALNGQLRREVAQLLAANKEENARIRVERVIREDLTIEAMEILELYCELLLARVGLLDQMKQCDPSLVEAVHSLIYAAPRLEIQELVSIREQFAQKFGKDFVVRANDNAEHTVNPRLLIKLAWDTPDPYLVNQYLKEIAKSAGVAWLPPEERADSNVSTQDLKNTVVNAQTIQELEKELEEVKEHLNPSPSSEKRSNATVSKTPPNSRVRPSTDPTTATSPTGSNTGITTTTTSAKSKPSSDFEELARRFEALKSRK